MSSPPSTVASGPRFASGVVRDPRNPYEYPPLGDFDNTDPIRDASLYASAPWMIPAAVREWDLLEEYVIADRLPGGLPLEACYTEDWLRRCAVPTEAIKKRLGETPQKSREAYCTLVYARLGRSHDADLIPESYGFDTWSFRTYGESYYGAILSQIDYRQWRGQTIPRDDALCFDRPILRAEFRYVTRYGTARAYWRMIEWERRMRSRTGFFIPYQCLEAERLTPTAKIGRYVRIPDHFADVEVPRGCYVDLPPVLTYKGVEMMQDPSSGLWVVFYAEYTARVAAFLLWEVYDRYRLWFVPERLRQWIIDETDWSGVPKEWAVRGRGKGFNYSPGRTDAGGDYILYDPWSKEKLNSYEEVESRRHRRERRTVPENHPTGYHHYEQEFNADGDDEELPDREPEPVAPVDIRSSDQVRPAGDVRAASEITPMEDVGMTRAPTGGSDSQDKSPEEIVLQFLRSAGVNQTQLSGDMAAMRDFVARMVGVPADAEGGSSNENENTPSGEKGTEPTGESPAKDGRNARFSRGRQDSETEEEVLEEYVEE